MLHKPEISGYVRPLNQQHAKRCYQLFYRYCQSVSFWINNAEPLPTPNPSLGRIPLKLSPQLFIYLIVAADQFFSGATSGSHNRKSILPEKDPEWTMWMREREKKKEEEEEERNREN